jgi:hypothetical protein
MAISYVGGVQSGRAGATTTTTQSLSGTLTGGSNTSPSAGDLVVVWCASGADTTAAPSQDISGNNNGAYTGLTAQSSVVATTYDTYSRVSYKIQGSTVDTSITIPSSGSARNAQRWVVHVFRGVDATTPMDVTATYATGTGTGRPNPASITPTTAGAWICAFYASAAATGVAYTFPTDFAADWLGGTTSDTADVMTGAGYYTGWTSGAYDPAAIVAGGTINAADTWTATTIALRPASTTPQYTKTHTTDSLKRLQTTKTHTTDSYRRVLLSSGSLRDNFNDNSLSSSWVNNYGARIAETNNRIEFNTLTTANYYSLDSADVYNITSSYAGSQLVNAGNQSLTSLEVYPVQIVSGSTNAKWVITGGNALTSYDTGGGNQNASSMSHTNGNYYRIREASGTLYWEYSSDGLNWTSQYSRAGYTYKSARGRQRRLRRLFLLTILMRLQLQRHTLQIV